jgi:hypothetical protein
MTDKSKLIIHNNEYLLKQLKIIDLLLKNNLYDDCILFIEKVSKSSWFNFNGFYTIKKIENDLSLIANKKLQFKNINNSFPKENKKKILHFFSEIYSQGGHTKVIFNWVKNDLDSNHFFLSTRQTYEKVKEISEKNYNYILKESDFYSVEGESNFLDKAQSIIDFLYKMNFSSVILHIHQDDVLPNLIFSNKNFKFPVLFFNHADHQFWLGSTIADLYLIYRKSSVNEYVEKRKIPIEKHFFLPIPVEVSKSLIENKEIFNNKKKFKILSIGAGYKYNPNDEYDFFKEILKILNENNFVTFTIIGIEENNLLRDLYQHERLILHPFMDVNKIYTFYQNSDLYISGFPFPSHTALLEAAFFGVPFVLTYNPYEICKFFKKDSNNYIEHPKTIKDWHKFIYKMINNESFYLEVKKKQSSIILNNFNIQNWQSILKELEFISSNITHNYCLQKKNTLVYNGRDEVLLYGLHNKRIDHFSYTHKLPVYDKLLVFIYSLNTPKWVIKLNLFDLINYFFEIKKIKSFYEYKIKRLKKLLDNFRI